jgi:outer membrane protein TolC
MKKFLTIALLFCCLTFTLSGQESLSLAKAIETGLQNNYNIEIARENIEIAQLDNDWGMAGRYPTINLNLNSNNGFSNSNNPASFLTEISSFSTGLSPSLDANWILFDGYRVRLTKQRFEELQRLSEGNLQIAVENTIRSIILAYYAALVQEEQLGVLEEVLELSRDRITYQEVRQEFGQAVKFDLLQTQDAYLEDSTNYLIQKTSFENALRDLNLAMGVDDLGRRYSLADPLTYETSNYQLQDLRTKMFANNRNLQNLFINREVASLNTRLAEAALSPTVSVRGSALYNANLSSGSGTLRSGESLELDAVIARNLNVGVNFTATYNLFNGGVTRRNIDKAKRNEIITQLNVDETKRQLSAQLENTLATFNNQRALMRLSEERIENAQQNLEIAEERFRGGLINSFDYRTIQLAYINASQARLSALFNLKNTETELIRLIGGLVR